MSIERRIAAFLELAGADLDAAEVLSRVGNRYAAYHVQQALEKLIKALLLHRNVEAGLEHRLESLADRLPPGDAWPVVLEPFLAYSTYATTFRYPTPGGRIANPPPSGEVLHHVDQLRQVLASLRAELLG